MGIQGGWNKWSECFDHQPLWKTVLLRSTPTLGAASFLGYNIAFEMNRINEKWTVVLGTVQAFILLTQKKFVLLKRLGFYFFNSKSKILGLTRDFVAAALHTAVWFPVTLPARKMLQYLDTPKAWQHWFKLSKVLVRTSDSFVQKTNYLLIERAGSSNQFSVNWKSVLDLR